MICRRLCRLVIVGALLFLTACKQDQRAVAEGKASPPSTTASDQHEILWVDTLVTRTGAHGTNHEYIAQVFVAEIGESPRMGWLVPPERVLAKERHHELFLYASSETPFRAQFSQLVSPAEHRLITRTYHVACESDSALAAYELSTPISAAGRVLYTSGSFAEKPLAGIVPIAVPPEQLVQVSQLLEWPPDSSLQLHQAYGVALGYPFYSTHALYDSSTESLVQSALMLHDSKGNVIAWSVAEAREYECDGCAIPSRTDGLRVLYYVMNIYSLPGFLYPVLLLDSSTMEGRALSLVTFTPEGEQAEYRIYEYVVNCIL
jgi:hypothetical protein